MKEFIEYFKGLTKMSYGLEKELISKSIPMTVNKGEFLHIASSICKNTFWIHTKGIAEDLLFERWKGNNECICFGG